MSKKKKTREENMDEIVFAHRNKEYGAYELRKKYNKNVVKSMGFAFFLLLLTTITPLIMALNDSIGNNIVDETVTANLLKIDNPIDVPPPPPPPPPDPVQEEQKVRYTAPEIVDSVDKDIVMLSNDDLIKKTVPDDIPAEVPETKDVIKGDEVVNFYVIEEKPSFPGGEKAMMEWLANNTKYPDVPKESGVTGKVFVKFIIDKEGKVTDVELLNNVDPYLDKEALRVVSEMPSWTPGKQRGETVKVSFQIPIKFILY